MKTKVINTKWHY